MWRLSNTAVYNCGRRTGVLYKEVSCIQRVLDRKVMKSATRTICGLYRNKISKCMLFVRWECGYNPEDCVRGESNDLLYY